jgi:hypothetical protein
MEPKKSHEQLRQELLTAWERNKTSGEPVTVVEINDWLAKLQACLQERPLQSKSRC